MDTDKVMGPTPAGPGVALFTNGLVLLMTVYVLGLWSLLQPGDAWVAPELKAGLYFWALVGLGLTMFSYFLAILLLNLSSCSLTRTDVAVAAGVTLLMWLAGLAAALCLFFLFFSVMPEVGTAAPG